MEDQTPNTNVPSDTSTKKSVKKLAIVGFLLMLCAPALLFPARNLGFSFPNYSFLGIISVILTGIAFLLPATGAVLCIIHLVKCKKSGEPKSALSIITLVMCNPFFYFIYFVVCAFLGSPLTGLAMM